MNRRDFLKAVGAGGAIAIAPNIVLSESVALPESGKVYYPPVINLNTGYIETGIVNYEYPSGDVRRYGATADSNVIIEHG